MRDAKGNIVSTGTYVPPALRKTLNGDSDSARRERLNHLKKLLKGQINRYVMSLLRMKPISTVELSSLVFISTLFYRLSESNVMSISKQVEMMYRQHSRADVNETLRELVMDQALTDVITPDRLSMELAMLIALLHNNVGSEVGMSHILFCPYSAYCCGLFIDLISGAGFLEMLTEMFDTLHDGNATSTSNSKRIDNVTALLCQIGRASCRERV